MNDYIKTWHIHIKGQVQGIGYRPLVYTKAMEYGLKGWVSNGRDGVHIEINCEESQSEKFTKEITEVSPPSLAIITAVHRTSVIFQNYSQFTINKDVSSASSAELSITADFALCSECTDELSDLNNRRYNYPFITCTNCGPRYSIIDDLPYDREHTKMKHFLMCKVCTAEYENPNDRRYYSQTNSCPECGITLSLYDSKKTLLSSDNQSIINKIVDSWKEGKILAIKGIGGFLLTCDAQNIQTVLRLRQLKHRPSKPFAIMIPSLGHVTNLTDVEEYSLMDSISPIVLLDIKKVNGKYSGIHNGLDKMGVMTPYAPLFKTLLNLFQKPIVATSGNISNSPIEYKNDNALAQLSQIADLIVTNDREVAIPQDDSVLQYSEVCQQKIIIRRSRGMAPSYFNSKLKWQKDGILAMGAHLKSTFSILQNQNVYISQYLGDLDHYDTQQYYHHTLQHLSQLLKTEFNQVLVDAHPEYFANLYGNQITKSNDIPITKVQHHKAHFCALLGEHTLLENDEKILGVIWDGTGLGDDGNIWGSEFFIYNNWQIDRCAHLDYYPIISGDKMAREPRLSALSIVGVSELDHDVLQEKFTVTEWKVYQQLLKDDTKLGTSSMGRLFDAVCSLLDIKDLQSYEGEAAMLLEVQARDYFRKTRYNLDVPSYFSDDQSIRLIPKDLLHKIIADTKSGKTIPEIAAKFHLTLVQWVKAVAHNKQCKKIGFSGGVFQNSLLVDLIILYLGSDFELLFHKELSPNDECVSFGQLVYSEVVK